MSINCYLVGNVKGQLAVLRVEAKTGWGFNGPSYLVVARDLSERQVHSAQIDVADLVWYSAYLSNDEKTAWRFVSRAFLFEVLPNMADKYVITPNNASKFEDAAVGIREQHLTAARIVYAFFEQLPDTAMNEDIVACSTRLNPSLVLASFEHFNNLYDLFKGVELGSNARALKSGMLQHLDRFIKEQEAPNTIAATDSLSPRVSNKYFQIVPLGGELDSRPFVFVIMPFKNEELEQRIWTEVMKPALEKKHPEISFVRSDDITKSGKIDNQIYSAIVRARKIIAEVSGPNPNVHYELGLAHAFDKDVFMIAKKSSKLAFDVSIARAEIYNDDDHLRKFFWRNSDSEYERRQ